MEGNAITVKIGAETDQVEQGLKNIQASLGRLETAGNQASGGFDASFGKIAGATAVGGLAVKAFTGIVDSAFAAARGVVDGFSQALDLGGRLNDLSARTGETAGNVLLLERAFDNAGSSADKVGPVINKLQKFIEDAGAGGKEQVATMNALGLSYSDLAGKTPTEQMQIFADRINGIQDPAAKSTTAMAVFGDKLGGALLPLLANFSGELETARGQLGLLPQIMSKLAERFDNIGDTMKKLNTKFVEFAAGILSEVYPALEAIVTGLSRIDAAALGQKLANAFVGGENAMKGFQAAVDAFKTGNIMGALELLWESTKLQAQQTANEIYRRFIAAFQTIGDFIGKMFDPSGALFSTVLSTFELLGAKITKSVTLSLSDAFNGSYLTQGLSDNLFKVSQEANVSANKIEDSLKGAGGRIAEQFITAGAALPDTFSKKYEGVAPLFTDLEAKSAALAAKQETISAAAEKETTARAANNEQLTLTGTAAEKLVQLEQAIAAAQAAGNTELVTKLERTGELLAKEAEAEAQAAASKETKREIVALETELNLAKAAGNEEAVKALEKEIETKKAKEEIAKLTQDYIKDLGISSDEAGVMAANFVNAKNAANGVKVDKTTVSAAKEEASKAAEAAKSFATWLDYIKGVDPSAPTKSLKEQTADARKEITAFGDYIGKDLKNKSFPDIARELKIDTMGKSGKEQMDEILKYISGQREKLTGIKPVDEKSGETALENITKKIKDLGGQGQTLKLDASKSIEDIKGKLKENIDLAISTGEGTKHLSSISGLMGDLKSIMTTLSNKLPSPVLT